MYEKNQPCSELRFYCTKWSLNGRSTVPPNETSGVSKSSSLRYNPSSLWWTTLETPNVLLGMYNVHKSEQKPLLNCCCRRCRRRRCCCCRCCCCCCFSPRCLRCRDDDAGVPRSGVRSTTSPCCGGGRRRPRSRRRRRRRAPRGGPARGRGRRRGCGERDVVSSPNQYRWREFGDTIDAVPLVIPTLVGACQSVTFYICIFSIFLYLCVSMFACQFPNN